MAKKRFINEIISVAEINNIFSILKGIACNIFEYENFNNSAIMENILFDNNYCCLFYDKYVDKILPLQISQILEYDIYQRPFRFIATAFKDFKEECVVGENCIVVYDQDSYKELRKSKYITRRYAEKIALCDRLIELNIFQQKTTKIYQVPSDKDISFKSMMSKIDTFEPYVMAYKGVNLEDLICVDTSTDFKADKIFDVRQKLYDDYIQKVGGVSYSEQKKERVITDEIYYKQGGSLIIRKIKERCRKEAIDKCNSIFGTDIKIKPVQDINVGGDADVFLEPT